MVLASFLWFQLVAGIVLVAENLFHFKISRGRRTVKDWWGLAVAVALVAIAALEIFFVAYRWLPDAALWPTLLSLDVLAMVLYLVRVEPTMEGRGTASNA